MATLSVNFVGEWFLSRSASNNLSRGLRWNSGNPKFWTGYAHSLLYASSGSESSNAADGFLRAAQLNPLDPANWEGLASANLQAWDSAKAEAALRTWLVAIPHSPQAAWRLGNLLIIEDRAKEAFPYLKAAATTDPRLDIPLFDLAWKVIADPELILHELIPAAPEARLAYLQFLVQSKKLSEARQVWSEVRVNADKRVLNVGYFYVDSLAVAGMGDDAARVWSDLLAATGRTSAKPAGELMTNGDFEADLPNMGIDWRITQGPGYQIGLDGSVAQNGSQSLLISFDGSSNSDFWGVGQKIPVQPSHDYRFRAYLKTENITSDSGPRFSVAALTDVPSERFELLTEDRLGTNPWTLEQLDFRTGPTTHFVQVRIRRIRSGKLNNLIQGKAWIDNASLKPRP